MTAASSEIWITLTVDMLNHTPRGQTKWQMLQDTWPHCSRCRRYDGCCHGCWWHVRGQPLQPAAAPPPTRVLPARSVTLLARRRSAHRCASLNLLRYTASVSRLSTPLPCLSSPDSPSPPFHGSLSRRLLVILTIYFEASGLQCIACALTTDLLGLPRHIQRSVRYSG